MILREPPTNQCRRTSASMSVSGRCLAARAAVVVTRGTAAAAGRGAIGAACQLSTTQQHGGAVRQQTIGPAEARRPAHAGL